MIKPLNEWQQRVETFLMTHLPSSSARLAHAMTYSALGQGKRIRPLLVYSTGSALGATPEQLDPAAAAIEIIHVYSLIHDDLPAMDDSDLRRGRPSCHKQFDQATAILAGDTLQSLAFLWLAQFYTGNTCQGLVEALAYASGFEGMAGGQDLDLFSPADLNLEQLNELHHKKTGALIAASLKMGAIVAGKTNKNFLTKLDIFGKTIGLAFQVQDDILDVTADEAVLGKPAGIDEKNQKTTYPSLLGLEKAKACLDELATQGREQLQALELADSYLIDLLDLIVSRDH